MLKIVFLLALPFLLAFTYSPSTFSPGQLPMKKHQKDGYSISYPAAWELNATGAMGTSFILFAPADSPSDEFKENVNLIIQEMGDQKVGMDEYIKITETQVKTLITNSSLISSKRLSSEGPPCHRLEYTGEQGKLKLHFVQHVWIKGSQAFILTFTTDISTYTRYQTLGEQILQSFQIPKG